MSRTTLAAYLIILLFAGCGGKMAASVTGTVTLDGAPLPESKVAFHPQQEGTVAYGTADANGNYSLSTGTADGLTPGDYVATVVLTGPPPEPAPGEAEKPPPVLTPPKYGRPATSDLKFTVKAGANTIDLPLKSK